MEAIAMKPQCFFGQHILFVIKLPFSGFDTNAIFCSNFGVTGRGTGLWFSIISIKRATILYTLHLVFHVLKGFKYFWKTSDALLSFIFSFLFQFATLIGIHNSETAPCNKKKWIFFGINLLYNKRNTSKFRIWKLC